MAQSNLNALTFYPVSKLVKTNLLAVKAALKDDVRGAMT